MSAAISRGLPSFVREDVIGEMVADVLEGYLEAGDIRASARSYVADYHRQAGTWGSRSIDAELGSDGGRTLHDILAA